MRIEQKTNVECFQIHDAPALDPITVFFRVYDRQSWAHNCGLLWSCMVCIFWRHASTYA